MSTIPLASHSRRQFIQNTTALAAGTAATVFVGEPVSAAEEGFVPLFNGRNLNGWLPVNVAPNTFSVRDGMIVSTGLPTGVMRTKRHYENFIMEIEWRHMKPGGNAGIFVWSEPLTAPGVPFAKGIEVQVIDGDSPEGVWTGHGDIFSIHGARCVPDRPHPQGWERCLPSEKRAKPAGQWNHYRIEARDGRISLAVNGKVVSGVTQSRPRKGYLCLESEGSECHFRNLRIRELPSSNPPPDEVASFDQGFQSLYTGIDLSGWQHTPMHQGHWKAADWILACDGAGAMTLPSDRAVSGVSSEFIVDWRPLKPGAAAALILEGSGRDQIELSGSPGKWTRVHVAVDSELLTVTQNGLVTTQRRVQRSTAPVRLALAHRGLPVEFANVFSRERR